MKYFDFHTHAFTDTLAERAVSGLAKTSSLVPANNGTISGLRDTMKKNNITASMMLPIATKPSQQATINNWAAEVMGNGIYCCGTVHPDSEDALSEIERIKSLGLCGIKFHPEYQSFSPNEERMFDMYEKIAELNLFTIFHAGWDPYSNDLIRATPRSFSKIAKRFPTLKIVAAHMGGVQVWDEVETVLAGKFENVWLDTAVVSKYISDEQMLRIIKLQGADKVLFASDCPWDSPINEINLIERLPLSNEEKELIYYKNAEKLLKISL